MELSSSSSHSRYHNDDKALEILLDAFGSAFSLEQIASAYCSGGRNVDVAGEILSGWKGESSSSNASLPPVEQAEKLSPQVTPCVEGDTGPRNATLPSENGSKRSANTVKGSKGSKPRKASVSIGSVSSVLGKAYGKTISSDIYSQKTTKPEKIVTWVMPTEDLPSDAAGSDLGPKTEPLNNKDIENFLFTMLGDGFELNMNVIQDVLRACGYDAKKAMKRLLKSSSTNATGKDKVVNKSTDPCAVSLSYPEAQNLKQRPGTSDEAMEILKAWYNRSPEVSDDDSPKTCSMQRVRSGNRRIVSGPPNDISPDCSSKIVELRVPGAEEVVEEDKYNVLRKTARVNWDAMKAYYEAAVDAFVNGEQGRVNYLLEQGKFFQEKAREADGKSAGEILQSRTVVAGTEVTLDLHKQRTKAAIRLIKLQLSSFSGISSIQFLKVIVENNEEDITKGVRRRMVMKLLEKENINWTEEENGRIIRIKIDEIDPRKLSFAKADE